VSLLPQFVFAFMKLFWPADLGEGQLDMVRVEMVGQGEKADTVLSGIIIALAGIRLVDRKIPKGIILYGVFRY